MQEHLKKHDVQVPKEIQEAANPKPTTTSQKGGTDAKSATQEKPKQSLVDEYKQKLNKLQQDLQKQTAELQSKQNKLAELEQ